MNLLATNQPLTMSSREIAELTGKQHSHVKRDIDKMCAEINHPELEGSTFEYRGNWYTQYHLDKELTLCLISGYSAKLRMAIIKKWQQLEEVSQPKLPQTFAEALQLAANQAKLLEEAAPKVEFHDKIVNDTATFSLRDAAKKIQQRPNKFSAWLRSEGYLCQNNLPKQQYINQGLFKTHTGQSRDEYQFSQTRVTSKGLAYFTKKLGDNQL